MHPSRWPKRNLAESNWKTSVNSYHMTGKRVQLEFIERHWKVDWNQSEPNNRDRLYRQIIISPFKAEPYVLANNPLHLVTCIPPTVNLSPNPLTPETWSHDHRRVFLPSTNFGLFFYHYFQTWFFTCSIRFFSHEWFF